MFKNRFNLSAESMAVLAYLETSSGIQSSFNYSTGQYEAIPKVATWYNGRERGIVVYLTDSHYRRQINIAVAECRNSDDIVLYEWEQVTLDPPSIYLITPDIEEVLKQKYWSSGQSKAVADYVHKRLEKFWATTSTTASPTLTETR